MKRLFTQFTLSAAWLLLFGLFIGFSLGLSSCDSFLDVNTNPNFPEDASPSAKLPSIISNGFQQQYALSVLTTTHFTQHIASRVSGNSLDQFFLSPTANPFNDTYFRAASNIPPMIERANKEQAWHYVGAGKVLMAALLFHLTDIFGNIPYSDAFKGAVNYSPKYDTQEQIYQAMDKLLDEAIVEFRKTQPASAVRFDRNADILFQGNTSRWIKLAFALKARQYNHLTKKSTYSAARVLTAIDSATSSNAEDAQVQFTNIQITQTNFFSFNRTNYNARSFGRFFIQMLDGSKLGFRDPRYVVIAPDTARSKGVVNGSGAPLLGITNVTSMGDGASDFYGRYDNTPLAGTTAPRLPATGTAPALEGWYSRSLGVQMLVTNAEMRFVEAEAAFRSGNRDRAFAAYTAGITAHCDKLGVPPADRMVYLRSAAVAQNAAGLTLANIMQQKYIALFLHPEAWVDMRRLDYSADVYPGFQPPVGVNAQLMGQYPRRFLPGTQELLYNRTNAYAELGTLPDPQYIITPMWWDKP